MAYVDRSAGIVVFRSQGRIGQREYLLLDYGKHWDFPKGHPEKGESDAAAARRELMEETGIDDAELIPGFAHEIRYFYKDSKKRLVAKTVIFFLASTHAKNVTISDEHVGYAFLPYEPARKRLTFSNAREILRLAEEFLRQHPVKLGTK
jgi:bis(5'-nucleosidyl)-tetraphosphatase